MGTGENDILDLLKDKTGLLNYFFVMIQRCEKFTNGLKGMKERGFSQEGMLDKVIEISAIQSQQLKHLALVALLIVGSDDFDHTLTKIMIQNGRGDEALREMFRKKFGK